MIEFVKRAVKSMSNRGVPREYSNALACFVISIVREDIQMFSGGREIFDIQSIIKQVAVTINNNTKKQLQDMGELTPLDYAEIYKNHYGNPLVFLKNYQDNFGPIE